MTKIPFHNHNHNHKLSRRTLRRSYWSSRDTKQRRWRRKCIELVFAKYFSLSISNSLTWFLYPTRSTIGEKAIWLSILALRRRSITFSRTFIFPVRISLSLSLSLSLTLCLVAEKWKEKNDFFIWCVFCCSENERKEKEKVIFELFCFCFLKLTTLTFSLSFSDCLFGCRVKQRE